MASRALRMGRARFLVTRAILTAI